MENLWTFASYHVITALWLCILSLLIMGVSIASVFSGKEARRIFLFYVLLFVAVLASMFEGWFVGTLLDRFSGALASAAVSIFIGLLLGWTGGKFATNGPVMGGISGALVGAFVGMFSGAQKWEIVLQFCIFLLVITAVSFGLARLMGFFIKKMGKKVILAFAGMFIGFFLLAIVMSVMTYNTIIPPSGQLWAF